VPLAQGDHPTTSTLTRTLWDTLQGVLNKSVPLAEAVMVARLADRTLRVVVTECVYGPQQERRKALPLESEPYPEGGGQGEGGGAG
jgi:hypothetical protein